jgi:hypothetical protein
VATPKSRASECKIVRLDEFPELVEALRDGDLLTGRLCCPQYFDAGESSRVGEQASGKEHFVGPRPKPRNEIRAGVSTDVEDKAAFLPMPSTRISELKALEGIQRTRYLVATSYRTAYLMGLVCAVSLRPGYAPPPTMPPNNVKAGAAKQIMKLLDTDGKSPHWRDEFRQLTEPETGALAQFLIDVLRRRVACRDFGGFRELLKLAYDLHLANTPSASQAAEMLNRLVTFAKITGDPQPNTIPGGTPDMDVGVFRSRQHQSLGLIAREYMDVTNG